MPLPTLLVKISSVSSIKVFPIKHVEIMNPAYLGDTVLGDLRKKFQDGIVAKQFLCSTS